MTEYGLGFLESPPDDRDYPIEQLLATLPPLALPGRYKVPKMGPVLDQRDTPMCVAYSSAALKAWQDYRDQGYWFDFAKGKFFQRIGGGPNGAYIRAAMSEMLHTGYPTKKGRAHKHRIDAYYRVPVTQADIKRVIRNLGPVILGVNWAQAWFRPKRSGMLRPYDSPAGGHAIVAYGWNRYGLKLRNSWGKDWGRNGDCTLPWTELVHVRECWKSYDDIIKGRG